MIADVATDVQTEEVRPARLGWGVKILYGIGDIPTAIKTVTFGLFVLFFYSTVMGLPAALVGAGSAVMSVWDASLDPFLGNLSDNWRSRFGRRHAFMLAGALTVGVSYWLMFSPPQDMSQPMLFGWFLVTLFLFRTTTSVWGVPYSALGAELSQDYHERTSVNAVRGLLALVGTVATAGLSFVLFFPDTHTGTDPKLNYMGYVSMGVVFGIVMTVTALLSTLGTLRQRSQPSTEARTSDHSLNFMRMALQSLRNPSFRVFFFGILLFYLGLIINTSLSIYYLTYYAQITASASLSVLQSLLYVMSCLGVFFWLVLSRYVQKHRLYVAATVATAVLMLAANWLVGEGHLLGTGNVDALAIGQSLAGVFTSMIWFIPASMLADITDEDALETGKRREGSFFGLFNFAQQLAGALALLVSGVLIDWFAGLQEGQAVQTALTVQRIGMLYSLIPAALLLGSAVLMSRYSLTRSRLDAIQQQLPKRDR